MSKLMDRRTALVAVAAALATTAAMPRPGDRAPRLVMPTIDGGTFDLSAHRGKVVVVNFWATWCPPCRVEMPALDAWWRSRRGQGVELVGVSADKAREREEVKAVMKPFAYPAGLAADAKVDGFDVKALPVTYVIDREGVVRAVVTPEDGALTAAKLDALVNPLLRAK